MLTCLRIRDFAIIEELEVTFGPGLNVLTGETGAGKSILVAALQLVLGGKGTPGVVRTGAPQAEIEGLFEIDEAHPIHREVDAELVIRRVVLSSGRTRAYVNGRLVTAKELARITLGLADISSQHEHHELVHARTHLNYLDAFAELRNERETIAQAHATLAHAARALKELEELGRARAEREDLLRFQLSEIEDLAPEPDEETKLEEERQRLQHAEQLASTTGNAELAIYSQDGALCERLAQIAGQLESIAKFDPTLGALAERLREATVRIEDVAGDLGQYQRSLSVDPKRLAEVEDRLSRLAHLQRKYARDESSVADYQARITAELDDLQRHEQKEAECAETRDRALAKARKIALSLRKKRAGGAKTLGQAISGELGSLGMGDAQVTVELAPLEGKPGEVDIDGARLTATGIDRCEFLIAPNPGECAKPLRQIASGGELSRAMLAIKRVLAHVGPANLYVFDEVDAGVGGAVAETIGRKLADVAKHHQVLCITHLPQIAVFARDHFLVRKEVARGRTRSAIVPLTESQRKNEIARMLGGIQITERTEAAAAELLGNAQQLEPQKRKPRRSKAASHSQAKRSVL